MDYRAVGALNLTAGGLPLGPADYLERLQAGPENSKRFSVSHLLQLDSLETPTAAGRADSDGRSHGVAVPERADSDGRSPQADSFRKCRQRW